MDPLLTKRLCGLLLTASLLSGPGLSAGELPQGRDIRTGDAIVVTAASAPVTAANKTLVVLKAATQLAVLETREDAVKVACMAHGKRVTGWISRAEVKHTCGPLDAIIEQVRKGDVDRQGAVDAITKLDTPPVERLIACTNHQHRIVQGVACQALGEVGDERAIAPLAALLDHRNWFVRGAAPEALGKLARRHPRAVDVLLTSLKDRDGAVRQAVAAALGRAGDPRAIQPLKACVNGTLDSDCLVTVYGSLALLGDEDGSLGLTRSVLFGTSSCRVHAIEITGETGNADAVVTLAPLLGDSDLRIRRAAVNAIDRLGRKPRGETELARYWILREEWPKVEQHWSAAKKALLQDARSRNSRLQTHAVIILISIGRDDCIEEMVRILERHGSKDMAEIYLNSGRGELIQAARKWASENGYTTFPNFGDAVQRRAVWGSSRRAR